MYQEIMVPVDLAHEAGLAHALEVAADLARHWGARITYVGVTSPAPGKMAHTPGEFARKLVDFATAQGAALDLATRAHPAIAHDPTTEVDDALMRATEETGADLVVLQSHIPGLVDYVWPSNGSKIAAHAKASVLVVRGWRRAQPLHSRTGSNPCQIQMDREFRPAKAIPRSSRPRTRSVRTKSKP